MFKARAYRKNTYLHKVLNSEQPVETNAYLAAALADMHPPAATMPCLDLDDETQYDIHSAPLGYGRWGMPLLCAQLASPKPYVRLCAIHTLCEELVNPKKAYLAVQKYAVLKRLTTMLRLDLNGEHGFQHLPVVRALQALQTMAGHLIAAEAIAGNAALMAVLADVVMWSNVYVRTEAAVVLALIAGFYPGRNAIDRLGIAVGSAFGWVSFRIAINMLRVDINCI